MKELDLLLERFWIIKEQDKESYYRIKDAYPSFKSFLEDKLGYRLIITPYHVKLEKLPGKAESWMGIQAFEDKMEYAFLCLLLVFLEDKGPQEQFVLSQLTGFLESVWPGDEKVDWTLYRHRRLLVKVLRFATEMGFIKVDDGDEQFFSNAADTEVLYENTGMSRYFVRHFTGNILDYSSWKDIEEEEWLDVNRDRGLIRRNRVYRRLFMSPIVYSEGAEDEDYAYIKQQRNMLQKDVEDYLGSQLHVHKNGTVVLLDESKRYKDVFPDNKNISDIVLQLNALIVEELNNNTLVRREDDMIVLSTTRFSALVNEVRDRYIEGWSKEYREMRLSKLYEEITNYMKSFNMIRVRELEKEVDIMPLVGKIIGKYPKDFDTKSVQKRSET